MAVPPLDIYLSYRAAVFERRLAERKKHTLLQSACGRAAILLRSRRAAKSPGGMAVPTIHRAANAERWFKAAPTNPRGTPYVEAMEKHWRRRHDAAASTADRRRKAFAAIPDAFATKMPKFGLYSGPPRREATALCQARTGKIGLNGFLFKSKAFGVYSPLCRCGDAPETVEHLVFHCVLLEERQGKLRQLVGNTVLLRSRNDLEEVIRKPPLAQLG